MWSWRVELALVKNLEQAERKVKRIAATFVLLVLPVLTGCQLVVPSSQRAEEVCIGPAPHWAGRLAGMPEFVPYEDSVPEPVAPRPKFHPLPTRPVFTPWMVESPTTAAVELVNPLLDGSERKRMPADAESIEAPPGFENGPFMDGRPRESDSSPTPNQASHSSRNTSRNTGRATTARATTARSASFDSNSSRRSRWAEVRVIE